MAIRFCVNPISEAMNLYQYRLRQLRARSG